MSRARLALGVVGVLAATLLAGWLWGASGRYDTERILSATEQQLDLAYAREKILEARVSLYNVNFGDASRHLEDAKAPLRRARERFQDLRQSDAAGLVGTALTHVGDAQVLAQKLDQTANSRAAEAFRALDGLDKANR